MNSRLLLILLFSIFSSYSHGQKKSEKLKQKEKELQIKIKNTNNLIKMTRNSEQLTLTELGIIQHQIAYRVELVSNYNYQIRKLDNQVTETQKQKLSLENNIKVLKEEYKKMLVHAYKNRNTDFSYLYIISAKTFSEAFHRMKYIQHYSDYRQKQISQIKNNQAKLDAKINQIQAQIEKKENLTSIQTLEKKNYEKDKIIQEQNFIKLKAEESKYKSLLATHKKKKEKIALAVRKAIEEEIAATIKKTKKSGFSLTPEGSELSKTFTANKGRLPWPVEKGEITGKYGKHKHEIVSTTIIENNGVDITTENKSKVRAVFNGKVSSVLIIPGAGKVVMVSHGDYRTVYANLKDVYVKKGDPIKTKQLLGELLSLDDGDISEAHFEIWKITSSGMKTENPSVWFFH